jgi:integrase
VATDYSAVYSTVPAPTDASPAVHDLIDVTDASAQAALKRAIEIDAIADLQLDAAERIIQEVRAAAPGSAPIIEAGAAAWLVKSNAYTQVALQAYVTYLREQKYAPHSIDHFHEVLSAVLRSAVRWQRLEKNPAEGVILPKIVPVRPKWALAPKDAAALIGRLDPKPRAMVALALVTGMRRGELLGLRWKSVDEEQGVVRIEEACYLGHFDTPKTAAGTRTLPLAVPVLRIIQDWKRRAKKTQPEELVFGTRKGLPENPNNILRRHVYPACDALKLPRATWLTLRRTFSSWCHASAVPDKVTAELMGHANVSTTLNVYMQVVGESKRLANEKVGQEVTWPDC